METHRGGDRCRVTHAATPPAVVSRPPNSSVHPLHFIHSNTAVFYPTKIRSPLSRLITSAPFLHPYSTTAGLPHSQPAHHSSPDDESSPLPPSLSFPFHTTQAISINIGVLVLSSPAACASSAVILSFLLCCLRSLPLSQPVSSPTLFHLVLLSDGSSAYIFSRRSTTSRASGRSLGFRFHMSRKSCGRQSVT